MDALLFRIQQFCLHDGPGIRSTVFFMGCPLRCQWCANPESQSTLHNNKPETLQSRRYTLQEVLTKVKKDKPFYDQSGGGVTLSGGDPLCQSDFVCALCDALHEESITVGMETAAYAPRDVFARVLDKLDFVQIDLKHWDAARHRKGTRVENALILENIRYALAQSLPVVLRIPVIPGFNDAPADARAFGALLTALGAQTIELMPFHQFGESKYAQLGLPYAYAGVKQLHEEDLTAYAQALQALGLHVQIGG